jgi:hypothetical protein
VASVTYAGLEPDSTLAATTNAVVGLKPDPQEEGLALVAPEKRDRMAE